MREEKAASKVPVPMEAPNKDIVAEPVVATAEPPTLEPIPHVPSIAPTERLQVATAEPPVLEPIPHVASITPTEKLPIATAEEPKSEALPGDVDRLDPTFLPMSQMDEVTASQANLAPTDTEEPELERMATAESEISVAGQGISGDAEAIARRVFSAPVENETPLDPVLEAETENITKATSNVKEAPVVKAETATVPAVAETTPTPAKAEPSMTATKHDVPVATKVAPGNTAATPPAPTTETTVTGPGPSASSKPKEGKGVSSWLKTKFSRRASKSINPENTTAATDTKEKGFIGGATLTSAPEASNPSSDHGDSSMRDVAMAGKDTTANTTTAPGLSPVVSPNDKDLYSASPLGHSKATGGIQRESTSSASISSLSSDEDTRGRSAIPREREPLSQQKFQNDELKSGKNVDPALLEGEQLDPALPSGHGKGESSTSGGGEEFEEARDEFDSEKLSPPDKSIVAGKDRASGSPARDSKFLEDL